MSCSVPGEIVILFAPTMGSGASPGVSRPRKACLENADRERKEKEWLASQYAEDQRKEEISEFVMLHRLLHDCPQMTKHYADEKPKKVHDIKKVQAIVPVVPAQGPRRSSQNSQSSQGSGGSSQPLLLPSTLQTTYSEEVKPHLSRKVSINSSPSFQPLDEEALEETTR